MSATSSGPVSAPAAGQMPASVSPMPQVLVGLEQFVAPRQAILGQVGTQAGQGGGGGAEGHLKAGV